MTRVVEDAERRSRLARRGLLGAPGRADRTVAAVADRLALLHATDPATVHLALHARTDATQDDLDHALHDERLLLRHTCLRRTVFAMPRDVAPLPHGAYNPREVAKLRAQIVGWIVNGDDADVAAMDEPGREAWLSDLEDEVVAHLEANGPTSGNDLAEAVPGLRLTFEPAPGKSYSRPIRLTSKVLEVVAAEARIARGRPTGDLTSGAWLWEAMSDYWPGGLDVPEDPLSPLLARYLATFGPATTDDMAWWTGLGKTRTRAAMATIGAQRVELAADASAEAWLAADDGDEEPPLDEPHVALLPGLDSVPMGHKARDWWLGPHVAALYDRNGNAGPTAWADGRAVGAWTQRDDGSVAVGLLEDVDSEVEDLLATEAARTSTWLGDVRVKPRYPTPLQKALYADTADVTTVVG